MSFFARLFAPEITILRHKLETSEARLSELFAQIDRLEQDKADLTGDLKFETARNRTRESDFLNKIILLAGATPVAIPDEKALAATAAPVQTIDAPDLQVLERRAADYCRAKYQGDYSKAEYDEVLVLMKNAPDEWLADE